MKKSVLLLLLILMISCTDKSNKEELILSNPFLIGKWIGEGRFLHVKTANEIGKVNIEIEINANKTISGKIGDATLFDTSIRKAKYGFEIKGELNSKIRNDADFDKDHIIFLLILPDENLSDINSLDTDFHLKSNYTWDFGMRVGNVNLIKEL